MRSRLVTLVASALLVALACEGQPERIEELCNSVERCVGFETNDCKGRLDAAVDDHRLSQPGLARCADCLDHNDGSAECADVLVARDCDKACAEVQLVLNARTSEADREAACRTFHGNCSDILGGITHCASDLRAVLQQDPTLAEDLRVGACLSCIRPFKVPVHEGSGGAGGEGQGPARLVGLTECSTIIERCSEACDNVTAIERRFDFTRAALAVCRRGVRNCLRSLDPVLGAVPGAGGSAGEAPAPQLALEPQPLDECYVELSAQDADAVQKCGACEGANPVCGDLAANCSECRGLYPEPSTGGAP